MSDRPARLTLPIRKSLRIISFTAIGIIVLVAVTALWTGRRASTGLVILLVVLIAVVGGALIWALVRLALSRVEIDEDEVVLRYAIYPTVRVPRSLIDSVELSGAGGLFQPGEGLARGRRHLPVLVMDGGARIPVSMMSRVTPAAAERDVLALRQALPGRDAV